MKNAKQIITGGVLALIVSITFIKLNNAGAKKKYEPVTLAEVIADNILKNENDWVDSTKSPAYYEDLWTLQFQNHDIWVNSNCGTKIKSDVDRNYFYDGEDGGVKYHGIITIYSKTDTVTLKNSVDINVLAPVIDTVLKQRAERIQKEIKEKLEAKAKMREDSLAKVNEIKANRMAKQFCK